MLVLCVSFIRSLTLVYMKVMYHIQYYLSTRKTQFTKVEMPRNISNIYVRIYGKSIQFWRLLYTWIM